jgi:hypothetical protein
MMGLWLGSFCFGFFLFVWFLVWLILVFFSLPLVFSHLGVVDLGWTCLYLYCKGFLELLASLGQYLPPKCKIFTLLFLWHCLSSLFLEFWLYICYISSCYLIYHNFSNNVWFLLPSLHGHYFLSLLIHLLNSSFQLFFTSKFKKIFEAGSWYTT